MFVVLLSTTNATFLQLLFILHYLRSNSCILSNRCLRWKDENSKLHVNCSSRNVRSIPTFPNETYYLDLSLNPIGIIKNRSFCNLHYLQELNLFFCGIKVLEQDAFIGLEKLRKLNLRTNQLTFNFQSFPKGVFSPLKHLTYMNIINTNVDSLELNFASFSQYVMSDLLSLNTLIIDLFHDTDGAFILGKGFLSLKRLRVVQAGLCYMDFNNRTLENVLYLESFDLSCCTLASYEIGALRGRKFKRLNFDAVYMNKNDDYWDMVTDLGTAKIDILVLTATFHIYSFLPASFFVSLSPSGLTEIYLNDNSVIEAGTGSTGDDILPSTLNYLDFSGNQISEIRYFMQNLSYLNLERNNLGIYLKSKRYSASEVNNLTEVNLSFNKLYYLMFSLFYGHAKLEKLNLSNNFLMDITFNVSNLYTLKVLDMSNNRIQSFGSKTMDSLDKCFHKSDMQIDISGNVLQCSCGTLQFLKWIIDKRRYFRRMKNMICKFSNGTELTLTSFRNTILLLEKGCSSYTALLIGISVSIITAVLIVAVGLVYRYRWRLRYIYYMTRSKYKRYKKVENEQSYKYDAFISYSDTESTFIIKDCIPSLEGNAGIKLCIHQRDFVPGEEITHNITNSIHESRKTICIITRSFIESYYCMFEFNMARMESIYSRGGQSILFLVFYEQLGPQDLPLVMLELVQQNSYIEYPNDEQGNIVFWEKLKEVLS
ncbi:unnamed protein product [Mytilus edulis]|uniref:TIR domain-containing protein n=1 Tax=Mytilus edulis TaxID=6550 RepID=A0A8S3QSH3_MYTED|nr:unnamed protein product [Mytilus edulis]